MWRIKNQSKAVGNRIEWKTWDFATGSNVIIIILRNTALLICILIINASGLLHCTEKKKKRPTAI